MLRRFTRWAGRTIHASVAGQVVTTLSRSMRTLEFDAQQRALLLVDQTRLPRESVLVACRTPDEVAHAIRSMQVRGAPAIGVAAAYGMALGALAHTSDDPDGFVADLERIGTVLR